MNIDEKLKKLQEIADKLDKNEVTFEESLKLFEESNLLVKELYAQLNETKGKVTILKQDLDKYKEEGIN
ncbi:MAG TPA: exodeoxyribonuclease VII small subunit [Clostridiales bacterium]|mgnify:CR=1 FL=1|nr:exodeoxyribonuclease VII small subunit [Clostridiales bacterium]